MPRDMADVRAQQAAGEVVVPNDPDGPNETYPEPPAGVFPSNLPPPPPKPVVGSLGAEDVDIEDLLEDDEPPT